MSSSRWTSVRGGEQLALRVGDQHGEVPLVRALGGQAPGHEALGGARSVRPLAERLYDIRHWSEFERGGHFAAMEVPELLAADVRAFFLTRRAPEAAGVAR
ncbi:hypothetical protein GCM10023347_18020 [Streptomyces chumphonensis]|uniref:hypothetical protein n=1 Tax=Streptomyces chumphonensis TaxID=1214925 RepID=UPI003376A068